MTASAEHRATDLLLDAGSILSSSLDLPTTMRQVAELTVPNLADLCVIDLLADDGRITDVAVAASDPELATSLAELRARTPVDPGSSHPVARVIAASETALLPEMSSTQLTSFAQDSEHARFMLDHGYRSALVAPLRARARTLGAISVLRLGGREPFEAADVETVEELARRAALAIDNARLYGALEALERRHHAILSNLAEAITVEDREGRIVYVNAAAAAMLGRDAEHAGGETSSVTQRFIVLDESARELGEDQLPGRRIFAGEEPGPVVVRCIARASGEQRWLMLRSSPIASARGDTELVVNVFEDITQVKLAQLAESFMAQASRVLSSSMDHAETLRRVTRLAVPELADLCAIDLVKDDGTIEQAAVHHTDPAKAALAERLMREFPPTLADAGGVAEVIRSGKPILLAEVTPLTLEAYARNPDQLELLSQLDPVSLTIVPMASASRTLGTLTLVTSESMRRLGRADLALAERLARRAGTAVENARLYTERSQIAHVLQRALLPESLPQPAGTEVLARYRAAGHLNEVGGDFYDVFPRADGSWVLVIGDVVGKGARAAGVTALARHTLRAGALGGAGVDEMLRLLHRALAAQPPGADLCTVCVVAVTPGREGSTAVITLAGHPHPLLLDPAGTATPVGQAGTLLGVLEHLRLHETEITLRPGQTLLLYTDGVLDAGRSIEPLGEGALQDLCARSAALPLAEILERVERAALRDEPESLRDDIALLGLRVCAPPPEP